MRRSGISFYEDRQDPIIVKKYDSKWKNRDKKIFPVFCYVAFTISFCLGALLFWVMVITKNTGYEIIISIDHQDNLGGADQNLTETKGASYLSIVERKYADRKPFINSKDDHQTVVPTNQAFSINHNHQIEDKIEGKNQQMKTPIADISSRGQKPKLILHVGPFKTASTAIQSILKNKDIRSALLEDKFVVVDFGYRKFQRLLKDCFLNNSKRSDCSLWHSLMKLFDTAYEANNNVILSVETLSRLPINDKTISLWKNLLDQWDVNIILFYRPFDQWIRSLYVQNRKGFMYKSSQGRWIQNFSKGNREKSFPDWLQAHQKSNFEAMRDTIATKTYFDDIFGRNRVHVLDMLAPQGIEIEFLCNSILRTLHGCEVVRKGGVKPRIMNKSAFIVPKLDTDLIISEAYTQNLGDFGSQRAVSREKLESKLLEWNMTSSNLPKTCVSQEQENWLWNRTLFSHNTFSSKRLTEEKLKKEFAKNRKSFCSVDADAVLRNSTWRDYLTSCEFKKISCVAIQRKTNTNKDK